MIIFLVKLICVQAFIKIDASKRGAVTFGEVRKFYNAHKHPKVKSGQLEAHKY
jgi:hypothetical protein